MESITSHPRRIFTTFGFSILSSWIIGPIGVIYLHQIGWGQNPKLLAIILALSTVAPVQLLLNEFVAATSIERSITLSRIDIIVIFAFVSSITIIAIENAGFGGIGPSLFAISSMISASILLSYRISRRYFIGVVRGEVGRAASSLIGATPGIAMFLSCYVAGFFREADLLMLCCITPALAQIAVVKKLVPKYSPGSSQDGEFSTRPAIPAWLLYGMLSLLLIVGLLTAWVRTEIASREMEIAALVLIGLNLAGTVVVVLSRSMYLSAKSDQIYLLTAIAGALAILAIALSSLDMLASQLLWVAVFSLASSIILAGGRRLMGRISNEF